jgi:type VI secretion system protein ImpA
MVDFPALDSFLEDISPSLPEGESLRYDPIYDDIKESQRADDDLPKGIWAQDVKVSDWHKVERLCVEALQKESKDLQLCAWLTEAWLFLYDLEGVAHGLAVFSDIAEKYWDTVHPQIEPTGDKGFRLSPYNWLNEKLSERLKVIPITQKDDTVDSEDLTFADYIGLKNHWGSKTGGDSIPKDKEEAIKDFEKSIVLTPRAFFIRFKEQCVSLVEQSKNIEAFVTDQCNDNDDVPSLYRFRTVLEEMMTFAEQALKMKGDEETVSSEEAPLGETSLTLKESSEAAQTQEPLKNSQSLIKSREDAYQTIQQAADYLERLDPHSPVPPMIKRAIRWGKMPLKDVLQEVIKEPQALQEVKNLLGLSEGTE